MNEIKVKGKGFPIRVMKTYGEWEFSSVYSKPWPYSEVGCEIHFTAREGNGIYSGLKDRFDLMSA